MWFWYPALLSAIDPGWLPGGRPRRQAGRGPHGAGAAVNTPAGCAPDPAGCTRPRRSCAAEGRCLLVSLSTDQQKDDRETAGRLWTHKELVRGGKPPSSWRRACSARGRERDVSRCPRSQKLHQRHAGPGCVAAPSAQPCSPWTVRRSQDAVEVLAAA